MLDPRNSRLSDSDPASSAQSSNAHESGTLSRSEPGAASVAAGPGPAQGPLLHEIFEAAADQAGDRPAVLCGATTLSYRVLDERANRLARCLRARGIGQQDRVAILLPRSERIYEAMLAVLKAGAAYVPLDAEIPADRLAFILADCDAKCLLTVAGLGDGVDTPRLRLDEDAAELARYSAERIPPAESYGRPQDLCYVIYTSGTTGRPKGVLIEHRSAVHLVRAEQQLYGLRSDDRVFQFASVAFDASVEEIWMAFANGATLVVGTKELLRAGPEFCTELSRLGVTFFSCVPTFLALLEKDIPSVRILVLGGEVCPADVIARWLRPGRTVYNTYGPTEATVIATAAILHPNQKVTIGRPIAGYQVYLLDPDLAPVPPGEPGELCIGGDGVARGYLNRPELEQAKFVVTAKPTGTALRLYRSGDRARQLPDGNLEYLGRTDDQVKVRGFRIELSEIEAVLLQCPGVLAAAVTVHGASQRLAAYIVPRSDLRPERAVIRDRLIEQLPSYMVPASLDELPALPFTIAGKVDRKQLPAPRIPLREGQGRGTPPRTAAERAVVQAWQSVLAQDGISIEDDFFNDLGGHSLLAAQAVSKLRALPEFVGISIGDLYANPTVEKLATLARQAGQRPSAPRSTPEAPSKETAKAATLRYLMCCLLQALGVLFVSGIYAWQWLGAFLTYGYFVVAGGTITEALLRSLLIFLITTPAVLALSIVMKWALLGRIRPGHYPLWGFYYFRFWFVRAVMRAAPVKNLTGTPFLNLYYRLLGARIGRNVFLGSELGMSCDLLQIGEGSSVGLESSLDCTSVEGGMLRLAPTRVGKGCWVGHRAVLGGDTVMEDGSGLGDLSMLPDGMRIPAGDLWRGSPAAPAGKLEPEAPIPFWSPGVAVLQLIGVFAIPLVTLAAILPGLMAMTALGHKDEGFTHLVAAPVVALTFVVNLCLVVWVVKWGLLGRMKEGRFPVRGGYYVRMWFFDKLMDLSLEVIGTLYTTLYLRPWLRALGARIGPRSEVSTIRFIHPELLETGPECFLADDVGVGAPCVRGGYFTLGTAYLGARTFVGNSAILPNGVKLGNDVLVGVLSLPPDQSANGTAWLGSPAIAIPARQRHDVSESATYRPPRRLVALRMLTEFFRILMPSTIFVVLASLIINATDILQDYIELAQWLALVPLMYVVGGVLAILTTVLLKWLVVGRYRAGNHPLWSTFVPRSELVTGVYENLAVMFLLDLLRGTPFIVWVLRAFGAKIGRRCYVDTTWFTEFDLVEIGDEAVLNENANLQTHLFHDRVMTTGVVRIGNRCVIGSSSVVLHDASIEDGATLGELSLVMKGEQLPAGTHWQGTPARLL
jgi:non-ribosomal peptide synthetase-like protein